MLGMGGMAGAAGNLETAFNHLKSSFLVLQVLNNDAKVLHHHHYLVAEPLVQLSFLFFRRGGPPTQLRSKNLIRIIILGGIPHYHILLFSIWDDLIVDAVWDLQGFLMILQVSNHKGGKIRFR